MERQKELLFIRGNPENTRTYFLNENDLANLESDGELTLQDILGFNVKLIFEVE